MPGHAGLAAPSALRQGFDSWLDLPRKGAIIVARSCEAPTHRGSLQLQSQATARTLSPVAQGAPVSGPMVFMTLTCALCAGISRGNRHKTFRATLNR